MYDWVKKCYDESKKPNTQVVMLIPARTDTRYFHEFIYHKANYNEISLKKQTLISKQASLPMLEASSFQGYRAKNQKGN